MPSENTSIGEQYDQIAACWGAFNDSVWKKGILWPTIESLLPKVANKRVLDAGCGNGAYSAWCADHGADVIGVDLSREMIHGARDQYGNRAEFRQADIAASLDFLEEDSIDLVLCQHVLSHLSDLEAPFREFSRVLKPDGTIVVSTHNPVHDFLVVWEQAYPDTSEIDGMEVEPTVSSAPENPNYHDTEEFSISWTGSDGSNGATYYRRSVTQLVQPLLDAGFELQELIEPDLRDGHEESDLNLPAELLCCPPRSICFRAALSN